MRKSQPKKIPLAPDPKFNDRLVTRFVNNLMWAGKKSGAYIIFYDALDKVAKITGENTGCISCYREDRGDRTDRYKCLSG